MVSSEGVTKALSIMQNKKKELNLSEMEQVLSDGKWSLSMP